MARLRHPTSALVASLAAAVLLAACGGTDGTDGVGDGAPPATDDTADTPTDPATDPASDPGDGQDAAFDRDQVEAEARALLGVPEGEVPEDELTRIARRGDESLPGTMDLRPGRRNVELDEDDDGTYVVTRVIVEVPDGEDPIDVS